MIVKFPIFIFMIQKDQLHWQNVRKISESTIKELFEQFSFDRFVTFMSIWVQVDDLTNVFFMTTKTVTSHQDDSHKGC